MCWPSFAGASPTPPYTNWTTAATNIQDALDVATNEALVLVTNGVYSAGGTDRARVDVGRTLTLSSVNNPRLLPGSPCYNAGTNQSWMTDAVDVGGDDRIYAGIVDRGAYESPYWGMYADVDADRFTD